MGVDVCPGFSSLPALSWASPHLDPQLQEISLALPLGPIFSCFCHFWNQELPPLSDGRWERMNTYICMTESLHCSPETITTLLIGYTPVQNVLMLKNFFFIKLKKKKEIPAPTAQPKWRIPHGRYGPVSPGQPIRWRVGGCGRGVGEGWESWPAWIEHIFCL